MGTNRAAVDRGISADIANIADGGATENLADAPTSPIAQPPVKVPSEPHFVAQWLDEHHRSSDPNSCHLCGRTEPATAAVVPFGGKGKGYVWLHPTCWAEWMRQRQEEARSAYAAWIETAEAGEGSP